MAAFHKAHNSKRRNILTNNARIVTYSRTYSRTQEHTVEILYFERMAIEIELQLWRKLCIHTKTAMNISRSPIVE